MTFNCLSLAGVLAQATQPEAAATAVSSQQLYVFLGQLGAALALGIAAIGSSLGIGAAGQAAAGAWSKEGKAGKTLRFTYIIIVGLPISQTLYAMIVMNKILEVLLVKTAANAAMTIEFSGMLLAAGIGVGLAELFSAWMQGKIGAAGIRGMSESDGKGFVFLLIAEGIVETVGIFAMVFALGALPKV